MKRNMWIQKAIIGMTFGMFISSMSVLAYADEVITEDESYIIAEDETEAMIVPESDDVDEGYFDESFISEEGEPEIGDELTPGIASEETEEELQAAASIERSGTCSENLTWTLNSDGVLTIGGNGELNLSSSQEPFNEFREKVKTVYIENGVTSIGRYAFKRFTNLTNITIPDSVTSIGFEAFLSCESVEEITLPNSVTSIGYKSFSGCYKLTSITIPDSVESIQEYAFNGCYRLTSIIIPYSVKYVYSNTFWNAENLIVYGYPGSYIEQYYKRYGGFKFRVLDTTIHEGFVHSLDYYACYSSSEYNPELACDLMKLASDAYGPNTEPDEHNVGTDEDILADYGKLGFTQKDSRNYDKWKYHQDYCGYSFAVKDADDGGQIVVITVRGTVGGIGHLYDASPEWLSNLFGALPPIGTAGWHTGFYKPAKEIIQTLEANNLIETTNTKYFITGHSRGAGVGNVLAVLLSQKGVSKENLYDYNFACPDTMYAPIGTSWSGFGKYDNMFNINAANDLVGVVPGILGNLPRFALQGILKSTMPLYNWGKYGKTYFYSFDWNSNASSMVNIITFVAEQGSTNPHQPSLYYNYLSKKNTVSAFRSFKGVLTNNLSDMICFLAFCPVDITVVDGNGADIVSVKGGEVTYYNDYNMSNAIVMTDGDFKAFFVDPTIDCKVKIEATDSGNMAFVSGIANMNTGEFDSEKHFKNVKLEKGKTFLSEGVSGFGAGNVKLYITDEKGNKVAEVNSNDAETKIVKKKTTTPVDKITISKKPSIKKPVAAKGKITVKWKHFKHTSKKTKKIWKPIKKVQVQCATDKAFKNIVKTTTVKKSKTNAKIKGLKKKTTYYVRVRYYDGTGYSAWSKVKKVKTK